MSGTETRDEPDASTVPSDDAAAPTVPSDDDAPASSSEGGTGARARRRARALAEAAGADDSPGGSHQQRGPKQESGNANSGGSAHAKTAARPKGKQPAPPGEGSGARARRRARDTVDADGSVPGVHKAGPLLHRDADSDDVPDWQRRRWVPRVAGLLALFAGFLDLSSALTLPFHARTDQLVKHVPGAVRAIAPSTAATAVAGILLIYLAHALARRKRRAWRAVCLLLLASVVLHVIKGLDVEEASVSAILLVGLVWYREEFEAKGDPRTRWRAVWVGAMLAATSFFLGYTLIMIRARDIEPPRSISRISREVLAGLIGMDGPLAFRRAGTERVVHDTLLALGLLTVFTIVYLALRPPEPIPTLSEDDERRMRELLAKQGSRDSLGYFALRRDKNVVWSSTGKSAIAYRVVSGVMLASGDPIGDPEAWPGAIHEFLTLAHDHAWVPAVMGCSESGGQAWVRFAGLDALELGDEAICEIEDFTLDGRAMRNVRQCVVHVEREGYTSQVRRVRDIPAQELAEVANATDAWRGAETERGFSMALGRIGDPQDSDCVLVTAHEGGVLRGFLHFAPWGKDGLSLDVMRRSREADRGLNEYLIVEAMRAAPSLGVKRISLNFAVFRSALERGERLGAGPILRAWRGVLLFVSRWFQIETLYRFNAKFRPVWEPRYVCYPSAGDIPRIAIAALEAEAFIVWPTSAIRRVLRFGRPARA